MVDFAVYFKSGFIFLVHSFSCSGLESYPSSSSSSFLVLLLLLGCLKKSPNDLLSCEVLSLDLGAVEPRKGLLAANGFAEVELNALNGLLLLCDVSG